MSSTAAAGAMRLDVGADGGQSNALARRWYSQDQTSKVECGALISAILPRQFVLRTVVMP